MTNVPHDANVGSNGIAVWSVQIDENKNVFEIPSLIPNPARPDWSCNVMGPPNWVRGRGPLWTAGETPLLNSNWKNKLRIAPFAPSDTQVSVSLV
jgi:hypothetical protein